MKEISGISQYKLILKIKKNEIQRLINWIEDTVINGQNARIQLKMLEQWEQTQTGKVLLGI